MEISGRAAERRQVTQVVVSEKVRKNRGECVSFERETQLVSEYVAEAFESNRLDMPLILQATGSADT